MHSSWERSETPQGTFKTDNRLALVLIAEKQRQPFKLADTNVRDGVGDRGPERGNKRKKMVSKNIRTSKADCSNRKKTPVQTFFSWTPVCHHVLCSSTVS